MNKELEDGIRFILKNSLVDDNMIVLKPRDIKDLQASDVIMYTLATDEQYKELSLPNVTFAGTATIPSEFDSKVYVFV